MPDHDAGKKVCGTCAKCSKPDDTPFGYCVKYAAAVLKDAKAGECFQPREPSEKTGEVKEGRDG